MRKILTVVKKNLKLLFRSKVSALIIIFGPLCVTLFVGLAFNNTSLFNLKVGTYSANYDNLSESFLEKLREQDFSVTKFTSQDQCVESIKQGAIHACMVFPENLDLTSGVTNEITFHVDNSRVNIVYTIMDTISAGISSRTKEISGGLVQVLLDSLTSTNSRLGGEESNLVTLVEQNELIRTQQGEIDRKLNSMDLDIDSSSFPTSSIKTTYATRLIELGDMRDDVLGSVNASYNITSGLSAGVTKDSLENELDDIEDEVDGLELGSTKWTSLTAMINDVSAAVDDVSDQLSTAASARSSVTGYTGSVRTTLDTNLNTIMTVKGTVNDITDEIDAIAVTDVSGIVTPISTKIEPVAAQTYISFLYPSLVVMLIMFTTVLLGSNLILNEKRSKAFFRNLISPIKGMLFVYSTYLTVVVLLAVQLIIIFALTQWGLKIEVLGNIPTTLILLFLVVTLFSLIGITIGNLFSSEETASLAAISVSSIMLFLSNMILPLESMPVYIQEIARFNPFVISEQLLREAVLFHMPASLQLTRPYFEGFIPAIYLLVIYAVLLFLFVLVVQNIAQRLFIFKHVLGLSRKYDGGAQAQMAVATGEGTIAELVDEGKKFIDAGDVAKARELYISVNESYARLPKTEKKQHYEQIVEFRKELDAALEEQEKGKKGGKEEDKENNK